ncbi:hypothetical protein AWC38_SpisGene9769 [Stylophora pistillata]|uniref:Uncharacterized protein n=1 Tax=Stylophora pistillata TaxID=50429 RepID=A0A2B4S9W6_STYPI|nr:hypothetical protein AWC38_SpisGene9769 [Stylophora pistillata]
MSARLKTLVVRGTRKQLSRGAFCLTLFNDNKALRLAPSDNKYKLGTVELNCVHQGELHPFSTNQGL